MKILLLIFYVFLFVVTSSGQSLKRNDVSLDGLTQAVLINNLPALRIASRDANWIEVLREEKDGETALVFPVMRLKSFGLGVKPADEGKVYLTKTRFIYVPNFDKDQAFDVPRTEIKKTEIKKMRQGFDVLSFEMPSGGEEKKFVLAGTIFLNGNTYNNRKVMRPSLEYFYQAVTDFDSALSLFNELTQSLTSKKDNN